MANSLPLSMSSILSELQSCWSYISRSPYITCSEFHSYLLQAIILKRPVRFQVLTAASMKFRVFWDVAPCNHVEVIHCPDDGGGTHL
jgi:hypothetical protein